MGRRRPQPLDHTQVWAYYAGGQLPAEIGRTLGRPPDAIFAMIYQAGGIRPSVRVRSPRHLSAAEREEISRGLAAGASCRAIARSLGRSPSTVSRELARNGDREGYRAVRAEQAARQRACRPKVCKLALRRELAVIVADKLVRRWSPQQIAGWLRRMYPKEPDRWVSHETIYRSLFVQAKGALKHELTGYLRTKRVMRRPQGMNKYRAATRGQLRDVVSIRQRPAEAADRAVPAIGKETSSVVPALRRSPRWWSAHRDWCCW